MNIHDLFEEKARAGDGRFAIAFAIMELAEAHKSVATWMKYLARHSPPSNVPRHIG